MTCDLRSGVESRERVTRAFRINVTDVTGVGDPEGTGWFNSGDSAYNPWRPLQTWR